MQIIALCLCVDLELGLYITVFAKNVILSRQQCCMYDTDVLYSTA